MEFKTEEEYSDLEAEEDLNESNMQRDPYVAKRVGEAAHPGPSPQSQATAGDDPCTVPVGAPCLGVGRRGEARAVHAGLLVDLGKVPGLNSTDPC